MRHVEPRFYTEWLVHLITIFGIMFSFIAYSSSQSDSFSEALINLMTLYTLAMLGVFEILGYILSSLLLVFMCKKVSKSSNNDSWYIDLFFKVGMELPDKQKEEKYNPTLD